MKSKIIGEKSLPLTKPCPFCGGQAFIQTHVLIAEAYKVTCSCCGADIFFYEKEFSMMKTIAAWNRRSGEEGSHVRGLS